FIDSQLLTPNVIDYHSQLYFTLLLPFVKIIKVNPSP
ncbi:MAG: hypothetical protein XD85_0048, partial [Parcubacteria bacterium 34_609]